MPCFTQSIQYSGLWDSSYGAKQISNGLFLSSVPVGSAISAGKYGLIGVYRCTKDFKHLDDSADVVFIGRKKPVAEFGIFEFETGQISFSIPPPGYLFSMGIDYNPFTSAWSNIDPSSPYTPEDYTGTSGESALRKIVHRQHIDSLCAIQTNKGHIFVGVLYNVDVKDAAAGWTDVSMEFAEVGT